ncbi:MAG: molybdenum cofactor guanylyltransferase [Deltaproteobacteria bacterium]|nr:molybdenum cofactor guanylyltransferase [Deltaproteobacteria bacterium]
MGNLKLEVTGIILAGGKSSRMGRNKALLDFGGRRIIEHTVDLFKSIFPKVIIVTNTPEEYANLGIKTVTDIFPGKGSLGGIYTGLIHSSHDHSFIASCDMPFLRRELIEFLISLKGGYDVVVPRLKDGYEPLHAVYSKRCSKSMEAMINKGDLRIIGFYPEVRVREVSEEELAPYISEPSPFVNINTPEEYEEAVNTQSGYNTK